MPTVSQKNGSSVIGTSASGVQKDLPRRRALTPHDRQHRDPRRLVVAPDQERERPEVRRRPEEDDQEEEERRHGQIPGRRGPADQRRHRAGSPADDDVLRRRALQPARVDEHVEQVPHEREHGGQDVDEAREQDERESREREPELERVLGRDAIGGDRPPRSAPHRAVDVAVEDVVERARAAAGQREPEHRHGHQPRLRPAAGADDHPAQARQQQQAHDSRLGQRHVVAPGAGRHPPLAQNQRRRDERGREGERREDDVRDMARHQRRHAEQHQSRQRRRQQVPVLEPRSEHEHDERRHRDCRERLVRDSRAGRAADDREARSQRPRRPPSAEARGQASR